MECDPSATAAAEPYYRPLTPDGLHQILEGAFRILAERGVQVHSKTARDRLCARGAIVDDTTGALRLPRALVESAIDTNPSSVTLCSRDGARDAVLEGSRVHHGTGGTAIYVLDPDSGQRRPSTTADLILNARLIQALPHLDLTTINVFPNDVEDRDAIDVTRFFHTLDHMTKHAMGGIYSLEGCKDVVRMAELIAGSPEALRERPFISFITLVVSPLKIDHYYGDIAVYVAEQGLPLVVPTMPICGLTCPITLASNVMMCVAETLAGIALIQSVRPGSPGICGSVGTIMNLGNMLHVGGAVERAMIQAAVAQIVQHLRLPLYSTAGTTDAKSVDAQAAFESAFSNLLVTLSGANYIHDAAGLIESELTVAYEKLILDDEIVGMARRALRGIEVTGESLAIDLILSKRAEDHFAADDHTVMHMHDEYFQPRLANRDRRDAAHSGEDALSRAQAYVRSIRQTAAVSMLDPAVRARILQTFPQIVQPAT